MERMVFVVRSKILARYRSEK